MSTPGRLQAGEPGQIDGAFGVSGATQDAALLRHQRIQVTRPGKIGRLAGRVENLADRPGPLRRGHARPAAAMIHRHGKGRLEGGRVVLHDGRQIEPLGHFGQDEHAELPPPVGNHEIDDLGGDLFCRADEIPLVFAVLGIHHDDDFSRGDGLDGRFNGGKSVRHKHSPVLQFIIVGCLGVATRRTKSGPGKSQPLLFPACFLLSVRQTVYYQNSRELTAPGGK